MLLHATEEDEMLGHLGPTPLALPLPREVQDMCTGDALYSELLYDSGKQLHYLEFFS